MDIIYLLIPLAVVLLAVAIFAFFWAVRHDQFDDLDKEASRILFEEDPTPRSGKAAQPPPQKHDE